MVGVKMGKKLWMIGIVVSILLIIGVGVFLYISNTSSKIVCKSTNGNITIFYNDDTLTDYTVSNMSYNIDIQKVYAKSVGIDTYLKEFKVWFSENTNGSCTIKEKK